MAQMNMIQALNSAMDIMLARDPNVVMLGEDIGYFGGVFRVTDGLQRKYGEHRVLDTPIAEGAIVGAAIGMGVNGLRPGGGSAVRRLHLSGLRPDLQRARAPALSQRRRLLGAGHDPHALRRRHPRRPDALAEPGRHLHARLRHQGRHAVEPVRREGPADRVDRGRRPGRLLRAEAALQRPVRRRRRTSPPCRGARIRRAKCPTATTPCRSARPRSCARAARSRCVDLRHDDLRLRGRGAKALGIDAEIIDVRTMVPLDVDTICTSVKKTGRCLIAHEATRFSRLRRRAVGDDPGGVLLGPRGADRARRRLGHAVSARVRVGVFSGSGARGCGAARP